MSAKSFNQRLPYNTPGKFYVDEHCLDCDLCREISPSTFKRNDEEGTSYVIQQPQSEEEYTQAMESVDSCPCEAIHQDGDDHDWSTSPTDDRPQWRADPSVKPTCTHCQSKGTSSAFSKLKKSWVLLFITLSVIAGCMLYANWGHKQWRYTAAQSNIDTVSRCARYYEEQHGKYPEKIEDLLTDELLNQERLDHLLKSMPAEFISTNDGDYLIKYRHPAKPSIFFGVKKNGEKVYNQKLPDNQ